MKSILAMLSTLLLLSPTALAQDSQMSENSAKANFLGVGGSIDLVTTVEEVDGQESEDVSTTEILLNLNYGWNQETYEYGGFFEYDSESKGDDDPISNILIGGIADYNFTPNDGSATSIFALRGRAGFGQHASAGESGTILRLEAGPVYKYFGFAQNTAVLGEVLYRYQQVAVDDVASTDTGPIVRLGMQFYY